MNAFVPDGALLDPLGGAGRSGWGARAAPRA